MSELKICRICLRTECKVYIYDRFQLKPYYEEVMALKVNDKDGLPHYFCYECASMLHKFHKFKEKCYMGQKMLKQISWRGPITYEAVYKVDRGLNNLESPIEIITVSKRVKTYCTKDNWEHTDSETECVTEEIKTKSKNIQEVQYVSEDSITDRDDHIDPETDPVDENIAIKDNEDELPLKSLVKPEKDNKKINENGSEAEGPDSPKTVFVDIKKEMVVLKSEKIKERRRSFSEYGLKKINPHFSKKRVRFLDATNWKKSNLSEEEAIKEFRSRSENPKYIAAAYKCVDCFKSFSKEDMLKRHIQLRHCESLGSMECRFCHMRFKWDCHLRKHMRQHFTKYHCLRCPLVCSLETTAMLHEEYHSGVLKKCIHCGDEFKHSSTYYTHLRTHRSEYICVLCGASFVSPLGLNNHKKIKHVNELMESPDDDEEVNTFCEKCDIRFETRKAFEEHLFHSAMHTDGVEDEIDEISIPRKVLGKRMKAQITHTLKGKRLEDDQTVGPVSKRRKKKNRTHRKPTSCHQCGKAFATQAACMKHHLAEHPRTSFYPPNERHICEICGASLAPGSVATHQNMHTREKLHTCETCGRAFYSSVSFKRHILTHTGEKPFACSLCDKRFTQSNSMKLHYRTFHLKQPYPKRNRIKKKVLPPQPTQPLDMSSESEESDDSLSDADITSVAKTDVRVEPVANVVQLPERHAPEGNVQYLTLN